MWTEGRSRERRDSSGGNQDMQRNSLVTVINQGSFPQLVPEHFEYFLHKRKVMVGCFKTAPLRQLNKSGQWTSFSMDTSISFPPTFFTSIFHVQRPSESYDVLSVLMISSSQSFEFSTCTEGSLWEQLSAVSHRGQQGSWKKNNSHLYAYVHTCICRHI